MKMPEKPKTRDEQISMIWDALFNHVFTALHWQDIKINFILTLIAILIGIIALAKLIG